MSGVIYGAFGQTAAVQPQVQYGGQPTIQQQQQGAGVYYQPPYNSGVGGGGVNMMPGQPANYPTQQGIPVTQYPIQPAVMGQQNVPQINNWEHMVCEILNYEVNNNYQPRHIRIQAISEIANKYGIQIRGCGQNRLVLDLGKMLDGVNEYVLKIASCNLGVIDNMGEYLLSVMLNTKVAHVLALTQYDLGPLARYFKPIKNPEFHGRFIIQKKLNGLSEMAKTIIDSGNGKGRTLSQVAQDLLIEREAERQNIVKTLAVSCFIFDMGPDKPFNYGIDAADNRLKGLDYGYVVPYSMFDLCCGAPKGTYVITKNVNIGGLMQQKEGLKCTNSSCTGGGTGMMHYVEKDGIDSYVCDCCGHQVAAIDIKARLVKSWD